ncbi:hypothetical protein [Flavimaricola marinus]|uniref:Uncharacterized protein n=1 Tax=Flavimaricola marinus TaxID=1819565 RepID=A0A238LIF8_9RHOB|nr:hypothetical protein [Flavimaricola marinus]SMY09185.1 hypothetical protein LOM8899_03348 [Flavimaricola marinus]
MKGIAFWFYGLAVLFVTAGMIWGIQMAASGDHTLLSAHAHLNLVGWVTFALIGVYYHLVPAAAQTTLAKAHLGLAVLGVVLMVPGIAIAVSGGSEGMAIAGSMLTLAAMLIFVWTVWKSGLSAG